MASPCLCMVRMSASVKSKIFPFRGLGHDQILHEIQRCHTTSGGRVGTKKAPPERGLVREGQGQASRKWTFVAPLWPWMVSTSFTLA